MIAETFFKHYGLTDNPFAAEEARLDPIFTRLDRGGTEHPDFPKILGEIDQPSTSVVFGEKGSGKTAIRLLMGKKINEHNQSADAPVLVVAYDDLNPVLDKLLQRRKQDTQAMLSKFRLEDHQDAILARAMTKLISAILGQPDQTPEPVPESQWAARVKKLQKQTRLDLAVLAALYDEPASGSPVPRFKKLRRKLRLGPYLPLWWVSTKAIVMSVAAIALYVTWRLVEAPPVWMLPTAIVALLCCLALWGHWCYHFGRLYQRSRRAVKEMPAVTRSSKDLRSMLEMIRPGQLAGQPIPEPPRPNQSLGDSRYQLFRRFVSALTELGFAGMIIFIDRMDEPTLVHGDTARMKAITWPMFDNKFLKQDRVGLKLLLPLELRYEVNRESSAFFQEARLDKQNLIDRLEWSGPTLYDLCNQRLTACHNAEGEPPTLRSLFNEDVSRDMVIDALDQMHQPRDAFKFLYAVIQEHCKLVPADQPDFKIARLTLESVRRAQSQRVQELYRGRAPA
ncbi:MAG: hypothetical protein AAGC44_00370 [Planctomycetota bacterium]